MPFQWLDKQNGVDPIDANDINLLAHEIEKKADKATTLEGYGIEDAYQKKDKTFIGEEYDGYSGVDEGTHINEDGIFIGDGNPYNSSVEIKRDKIIVGSGILGNYDGMPTTEIVGGVIKLSNGDGGHQNRCNIDASEVDVIRDGKEHKLTEKQPSDFVVNVITTGNANDYSIEIESADKTYAEILEAYNAGKRVYLLWNDEEVVPVSTVRNTANSNFIYFNKPVFDGSKGLQFGVSQSGWVVHIAPDLTNTEMEELVHDGDDSVRQELLPRINAKADAEDVATQLSEKADKEEWRLINEVELTEDAVVEFTTDKDGNAFNLKKFKVTILMPKLETQSQVWLSVFNSAMYYLVVYSDTIPTSVNTPAVSITGELTYAWQFETCYSRSGLGNSGTVTSFPKGSRHSGDITGLVRKVKLGLNSGMSTPLPAGSKITLWGCE